jgi:hypothetical protein
MGGGLKKFIHRLMGVEGVEDGLQSDFLFYNRMLRALEFCISFFLANGFIVVFTKDCSVELYGDLAEKEIQHRMALKEFLLGLALPLERLLFVVSGLP